MHEILILYFLTKSQNTMYGIAKEITKNFGYISNPSFGTLQPALKRMEQRGYVTSSKFYTAGGKPSFYYSITSDGQEFLRKKMLSKLSRNPIQIYPEIKIKVSCCDILNSDDRQTMFAIIKPELSKLKLLSEKILDSEVFEDNYCAKMILDDSVCGYKNLYELVERLEKHAGNS